MFEYFNFEEHPILKQNRDYRKEGDAITKIKKCIYSCNNFLQLESCHNMIDIYFMRYNDEKIKNFLLDDLFNRCEQLQNTNK